jgi:hypothetical protein
VSTTNPQRSGNTRVRAAALIMGGTTLGMAIAAVVLRNEQNPVPTALTYAIGAALTFAVTLGTIWRMGGLRGGATLRILPPGNDDPRPQLAAATDHMTTQNRDLVAAVAAVQQRVQQVEGGR